MKKTGLLAMALLMCLCLSSCDESVTPVLPSDPTGTTVTESEGNTPDSEPTDTATADGTDGTEGDILSLPPYVEPDVEIRLWHDDRFDLPLEDIRKVVDRITVTYEYRQRGAAICLITVNDLYFDGIDSYTEDRFLTIEATIDRICLSNSYFSGKVGDSITGGDGTRWRLDRPTDRNAGDGTDSALSENREEENAHYVARYLTSYIPIVQKGAMYVAAVYENTDASKHVCSFEALTIPITENIADPANTAEQYYNKRNDGTWPWFIMECTLRMFSGLDDFLPPLEDVVWELAKFYRADQPELVEVSYERLMEDYEYWMDYYFVSYPPEYLPIQ